MSTWNIYVLNSDGITWDADEPINRPNQDLELETVSTETVVSLVDGSEAYFTPSKKTKKLPFTMFFANTTEDFRNRLIAYKENGDKVKIVDHKGQEYIGKFTSIRQVWFTGLEDSVDLMVTFRRDNSG